MEEQLDFLGKLFGRNGHKTADGIYGGLRFDTNGNGLDWYWARSIHSLDGLVPTDFRIVYDYLFLGFTQPNDGTHPPVVINLSKYLRGKQRYNSFFSNALRKWGFAKSDIALENTIKLTDAYVAQGNLLAKLNGVRIGQVSKHL